MQHRLGDIAAARERVAAVHQHLGLDDGHQARLPAPRSVARQRVRVHFDAAATAQVFDDHAAAYGGLDIAFANAGIDTGAGFWNPAGHRNPDGQVDTYDPARWDKSIAVNLSGMFYTVSNAVRIMKQPGRANGRTGGAVVCTASNAGLVTEPIVGLPYMPAKAGILHMVRALGLELAEFRIRINAIAPGPFVTNIGDGWVKKDPVAKAAWDAIVPLGRMAETDQIKPLALLLASDASDYMTGAHVVIDGGMMLGKYN